MGKRYLVWGMAVGLWLLGLGSARALEIVVPADRTAVRSAPYLIVKGGEPALEALVLIFDGKRSAPIGIASPEYRRHFGDMLIIPEPPFKPGSNRIEVEGYSAGKLVRSARAEIRLLAEFEPPPAGFSPFRMHLPERERHCAGCHNLSPTAADLSVPSAAGNPCVSCHKGFYRQQYVHGPVGSFSCGDCHSSAPGYPVPVRGAQLCGECHDDTARRIAATPLRHGPVAVGACEACHDPHAAALPLQLRGTSVNRLCLSCHETVGKKIHVIPVGRGGHPLEAAKHPRHPEKPFNCVSCHTPHGGSAARYLAGGRTTAYSLCGDCHDK